MSSNKTNSIPPTSCFKIPNFFPSFHLSKCNFWLLLSCLHTKHHYPPPMSPSHYAHMRINNLTKPKKTILPKSMRLSKTTRTHRKLLISSKFNYEVDSTFHYRNSISYYVQKLNIPLLKVNCTSISNDIRLRKKYLSSWLTFYYM